MTSNNNDQLNFLISKIEDLQTALFLNQSNYVLALPAGVVKTLHVDETGNIFFNISRPTQHINEFDNKFPVSLNYYQKGRPFYLKVEGTARLVIDPEEVYNLPEAVQQQIHPDQVLVSVKMKSANYHEAKPEPAQSVLSKWKEYVSSLFDQRNEYISLDNMSYVA